MELLDSRCDACKTVKYQCANCAKNDKMKKNQARQAAADKRAHSAMTDQQKNEVFGRSPLKATPTARRVPAVALPKRPVQKDAKVPCVAKDSPKYNLRNILKSFPHDWKMAKIPRNGHCLFESIAMAFRKLNRSDELPQTFQELRTVVSKQLLHWKGIIPNSGEHNPFIFDDQGIMKSQIQRGEKEVEITLQEYCELVSTSLYGGFDEIMTIV